MLCKTGGRARREISCQVNGESCRYCYSESRNGLQHMEFLFSFFEARDVAESTLLIGKHALKMLRSDFHLLDSVCRRRASRVLPTRRKGFVMTHVHQWLMLPRWCRTLCLESGCNVNENE